MTDMKLTFSLFGLIFCLFVGNRCWGQSGPPRVLSQFIEVPLEVRWLDKKFQAFYLVDSIDYRLEEFKKFRITSVQVANNTDLQVDLAVEDYNSELIYSVGMELRRADGRLIRSDFKEVAQVENFLGGQSILWKDALERKIRTEEYTLRLQVDLHSYLCSRNFAFGAREKLPYYGAGVLGLGVLGVGRFILYRDFEDQWNRYVSDWERGDTDLSIEDIRQKRDLARTVMIGGAVVLGASGISYLIRSITLGNKRKRQASYCSFKSSPVTPFGFMFTLNFGK